MAADPRARATAVVVNVTDKTKQKEIIDANKTREYTKIFNHWRYWDSIATLWSTFGLLLGMISYEIDISNYQKQHFPTEPPYGDLTTLAM